ncbi:MAG: TPM domain-containing protein [Sulfurimonas sp.]
MRFFLKIALLLSLLSSFAVADLTFPKLTGRVVDNASLLSSSQEQRLTQFLKAHEDKTTNQVVVVTLPTLQGYTIEEYGVELGRHWGIGQKEKNNGILLIVAPKERKVRIEVGYGLEGTLTDKIAHDIIQEKILPAFKRGKYDQGIENGTSAIVQALDGEYQVTKMSKSRSHHEEGFNFTSLGIIGIIIFLFYRF